MLPGDDQAGHMHLTKVARAISDGRADIHGVDLPQSQHLYSEYRAMNPVAD
jgi:hypothetical protein